jgi:hypothetical protein
MGSIVQLGNVPEWVQAAAESGALWWAVRHRREAQALDWAATLKELSGLEDEELRHVVEDNPVVAEIVGRAWEAASETASQDKRRLLAKVAAAAIRGDADAQADELQLLLRTAIELDPPHVTMLVAVGQAPGGAEEQLAARWPSSHDLLAPALSTLQRAGLAQEAHQLIGGRSGNWRLTNYGYRFLAFLQETDEAKPTS